MGNNIEMDFYRILWDPTLQKQNCNFS